MHSHECIRASYMSHIYTNSPVKEFRYLRQSYVYIRIGPYLYFYISGDYIKNAKRVASEVRYMNISHVPTTLLVVGTCEIYKICAW